MLPITANQSTTSLGLSTSIPDASNTSKLQETALIVIAASNQRDTINQPYFNAHVYVAIPQIAGSQKEVVEAKIIDQLSANSLFNSEQSLNVSDVLKLANPQIFGAGPGIEDSFNPNACILAAMLVIFSILGESLQKTQDWQKAFMLIVSTLQSYAVEMAGDRQQESRELTIKHNEETEKAMRTGGIWKALLKIVIGIVTIAFTAPVAPAAAAISVFLLATQIGGDIAQIVDPKAAMDPDSKIRNWSQNGIFALAGSAGNKLGSIVSMATLFTGQGLSMASLAFSSTSGILSKMASWALIADKGFEAFSTTYSIIDPKATWASFGSMGALALAVHLGFSVSGTSESDTKKIFEIALCTLAALATGYAISQQLKRSDMTKMQQLMPFINIVAQHLNIIAEAVNVGNKTTSFENSIRTAAENKFNADAEFLQINNQVTQNVYRSYLDVAMEMNPELLKFMEAIVELIKQTGQIFDDIYRVKQR